MMQRLLILCLFFSISASAQHFCQQWKAQLNHFGFEDEGRAHAANTRSDSLDVLHYHIAVHEISVGTQSISASCSVLLKTKVENVSTIFLDLENLVVTEVLLDGSSLAFEQVGELLSISLPAAATVGEEFELVIDYGGQPQQGSFGGFYFSGNYAYNLGVGIGIDPPTYGRAWFPCVDNFVERSTYSFSIVTEANEKAFCNGTLQTTVDLGGQLQWNWELQQEIPTYLASMAVAPYETVRWTHISPTGQEIPVELGAVATDTLNLKNSFVNLDACITGFEEAFGPYRWDRIGFVMVPFNGGAMEHATNIAYPRFAISGGTLSYEDLMAHEFAHHWFGDLVTCETADDMWLNEGWASWAAFYFYELLYGKERYDEEVAANHERMLHYAHILDGGNYPVSGVPADLTYGSIVYSKGAEIAHTLRGAMGDDAFFMCIKNYMESFQFDGATSEEFRDFLTDCSGVDMSDFFNGWVFNPGYPQFAIDSMQVSPMENGNNVRLYIRQKLVRAPEYYRNVPIDVSFIDQDNTIETQQISIDGHCTVVDVQVAMDPEQATLDLHRKLSDASLGDHFIIEAIGDYNSPHANFAMNVSALSAPIYFRIQDHVAAPDRLNTVIEGMNLILSEKHYWEIEIVKGEFDAFSATGELRFNGTTNGTTGYHDDDLFQGTGEGDLHLLFRESTADDWAIYPQSAINFTGLPFDNKGKFDLSFIRAGQYAIAVDDPNRVDELVTEIPACINVGVKEFEAASFNCFPNPASDQVKVTAEYPIKSVAVYSLSGVRVLTSASNSFTVKNLNPGVYFISVNENEGKQKLVVY